jgi:hypothetical protein
MVFFWAFVVGGFIFVIGQIMFDVFKLSPAINFGRRCLNFKPKGKMELII